jgi:hypothetical protein
MNDTQKFQKVVEDIVQEWAGALDMLALYDKGLIDEDGNPKEGGRD